jgi:hypothetical protein
MGAEGGCWRGVVEAGVAVVEVARVIYFTVDNILLIR